MGLFSGLFDAAGDFATAYGDVKEGDAYGTAEKYAKQNAVISQEAGDIKTEQANRAIYKTLGAQQAGYGGAGLASSGSAQDVLRDSVMQGSLEKAVTNEQTQINVTGYEAQAAQFGGMKAAADAAAVASAAKGVGGVIKSLSFGIL